MNSLYQFIIKPIGDRYDNKIKVDNKELIINSSISDHKFINRTAEVVSIPLGFKTKIQKGDIVIVHHNLFRRYYDMKGKSVNGSKFFKDNLYFAEDSQIFLYKNKDTWKTNLDFCFVTPLVEQDDSKGVKLKKNVGILKYDNSTLKTLDIAPGDVVGFKPNREFQFTIDKEILYCMQSNDITIKYEYQGNEIKYNPSWSKSS
jgi:co-chaperonin GroES (HSP10)